MITLGLEVSNWSKTGAQKTIELLLLTAISLLQLDKPRSSKPTQRCTYVYVCNLWLNMYAFQLFFFPEKHEYNYNKELTNPDAQPHCSLVHHNIQEGFQSNRVLQSTHSILLPSPSYWSLICIYRSSPMTSNLSHFA